MTRTLTTTTIAALAALAWLPPSTGAAAAQETTIQDIHRALEHLQRAERPDGAPAKRFLRQLEPAPSACRFRVEDRVPDPGGGFTNRCRFDPDPRTAAELDAFADRVAAVAADATLPDDVRMEARFALGNAASSKSGRGYEGTPYPRAFDLLVEVYESGYDPRALSTIMWADSVRGMAYVRELFERSERPPMCPRGDEVAFVDLDYRPPPGCEDYSFRLDARDKPFCRAGRYLFKGVVAEAWARTPGGKPYHGSSVMLPEPVPDGLPEEVEDWHRRCL